MLAHPPIPPERLIDGRTTRHEGDEIRQRKRTLVEDGFSWGKTICGLRTLQHRGREKVAWIFRFTNAAYHLVRVRTLIRAGGCACARPQPPPPRRTRRNGPCGAPPSPARRTPRVSHHRLNSSNAKISSISLTPQRFSAPCY